MADIVKNHSHNFISNLEMMEYNIKTKTKAFLEDNFDCAIFCVEAREPDVTRVLLVQIIRSLKQEKSLKENFNILFEDFDSFITMSREENEDWQNNFPNLLVCKVNMEEHLQQHFDIVESWINIVEDKSKKIIFIMKDSKYLEKKIMTMMVILFTTKFDYLWKNEAKDIVEKNDSITSSRALGQDIKDKSIGTTILHDGAEAVTADLVNVLKLLGSNPVDKKGNTQLHLAAERGDNKIIESLLAYGAKEDMKNINGETALHLAVKKSNIAIVNMLLERGANVNSIDNRQFTPLHLTCIKNNNVHLIELLLKFGANIEEKDKSGYTPLHFACRYGHNAVVSSLLQHGAKINAIDNDGDTPLHTATQWWNKQAVLILLQNGADIKIRNKHRKTALDVAKNKCSTNFIAILQNYAITTCINAANTA